MEILNDYYMVKVDQLYEVSVSPEGIITLAAAWLHSQAEERHAHKRIYGDVIGKPRSISPTKYDVIDHGYPDPTSYRSGEYVENLKRIGHKHVGRHTYSCAGFDGYEELTLADWARNCDIEIGDKAYFDPRVTDDEPLGYFRGKQMFKMRVDQIICVVRNSKIIMQGDWCLVAPIQESWELIQTASGIYKKPMPGAEYMKGMMKHCRRDDLRDGDNIIHRPGMDWTIKVEGVEYYAIQNVDILCKFEL